MVLDYNYMYPQPQQDVQEQQPQQPQQQQQLPEQHLINHHQPVQNGYYQSQPPAFSWLPPYSGTHVGMMHMSYATHAQPEDSQFWHHQNVYQPHQMQEYRVNGPSVLNRNNPAVHHQVSSHSSPDSEGSSPATGRDVSPQERISPLQLNNVLPENQQSRPQMARSPYSWIRKTSYQSQPTPGRTRTRDKYRVVYTDHQRMELEREFTFQNKYITIKRKSELASNLGLSERQIKIWFQNRRAKERKQNKKRAEEKTSGNNTFQQNILQHQMHPSLQQAGILPHILHNPAPVMQRFIDGDDMKLEDEENRQLD